MYRYVRGHSRRGSGGDVLGALLLFAIGVIGFIAWLIMEIVNATVAFVGRYSTETSIAAAVAPTLATEYAAVKISRNGARNRFDSSVVLALDDAIPSDDTLGQLSELRTRCIVTEDLFDEVQELYSDFTCWLDS